MAFTYNDPVIFMEYAIAVADACRERGYPVAVTTAASAPNRVTSFRHFDAVNTAPGGLSCRR